MLQKNEDTCAPPRVKIADAYRMAPPVPPPQKRYYPPGKTNGDEERDEVEDCEEQLRMIERGRPMHDLVQETADNRLYEQWDATCQYRESDVGFALAFVHCMFPGQAHVEDSDIVVEAAQALYAISTVMPGLDQSTALGYLIDEYKRSTRIDVNAIAQNILSQQQGQSLSSYHLYGGYPK